MKLRVILSGAFAVLCCAAAPIPDGHDDASACELLAPAGSFYVRQTQCAVLANSCDNWPQAVCMYRAPSLYCECL